MTVDNKIATTNNLGDTTSQIAKITTTEMARSMVLKYAEDQLGKDRAKEFFMHLGFLMRTNPAIANCTPESIFKAMMQCVRLDLLPNTPEQYCALIPYGRELQMQPMYPGGIELAYRSGIVKTIKADNVFAEDYFEYDDAMNEIHHKKNLTIDRTDPKGIVAAYAVAKLKDSEIMFEVMSPSEIEKIKTKAVKAKGPDSPWSTWEERMIRKSPLKRLFKVLPSSSEDNRFKQWARLDDLKEAGRPIDIDMKTGEIIEGDELTNVKADDDKKKAIVAANTESPTMSAEEAGVGNAISNVETSKPVKPKLNVKEEANRRWGNKSKKTKDEENLKQAGLLDDKDS